MTRRLLLIALSVIMLLSVLTGCGVNDLEYLKLSREISDITEFSFTNNTELNITQKLAGESYNISFQINGEADIDNFKSVYLDFDLLFNVNEISIDKPIKFIMADNKIYISKNSLLEALKAAELSKIEGFEVTDTDKRIIDEVYNKDLKEVEYILLTDFNKTYESIPYDRTSYKEIRDDSINYMTSAFEKFDSNLVKKTSNGYSFELTSESAVELIEDIVKYVSENKESVFDETISYIKKIYDIVDDEDLTYDDKDMLIQELNDSRQDFYDFIDEAEQYINSGEFGLESYAALVKDSKIKAEISKDKNSYKKTIEGELIYLGNKFGKIKSSTSIIPTEINKKGMKKNIIDAEEFDKLCDAAENRINPMQKLELRWPSDNNLIELNSIRLDESVETTYEYYSFIDGSLYVPIEAINESMEENIVYDDANKTAYATRGERRIYVAGILNDATSMIKIRDLEQLGYSVEYKQIKDGTSVVTITK